MSEQMLVYLDRLERNMMTGSARWIADFTESFRDYRIGKTRFAMFLRGNTRTKGFFLSRLVAYFSLPDYLVACFAYDREPEAEKLHVLLGSVRTYMQENEVAWSWLVISKEGSFSPKLLRRVEELDIREIGVALVDVASRQVHCSASYVGRRMASHVRCFQ